MCDFVMTCPVTRNRRAGLNGHGHCGSVMRTPVARTQNSTEVKEEWPSIAAKFSTLIRTRSARSTVDAAVMQRRLELDRLRRDIRRKSVIRSRFALGSWEIWRERLDKKEKIDDIARSFSSDDVSKSWSRPLQTDRGTQHPDEEVSHPAEEKPSSSPRAESSEEMKLPERLSGTDQSSYPARGSELSSNVNSPSFVAQRKSPNRKTENGAENFRNSFSLSHISDLDPIGTLLEENGCDVIESVFEGHDPVFKEPKGNEKMSASGSHPSDHFSLSSSSEVMQIAWNEVKPRLSSLGDDVRSSVSDLGSSKEMLDCSVSDNGFIDFSRHFWQKVESDDSDLGSSKDDLSSRSSCNEAILDVVVMDSAMGVNKVADCGEGLKQDSDGRESLYDKGVESVVVLDAQPNGCVAGTLSVNGSSDLQENTLHSPVDILQECSNVPLRKDVDELENHSQQLVVSEALNIIPDQFSDQEDTDHCFSDKNRHSIPSPTAQAPLSSPTNSTTSLISSLSPNSSLYLSCTEADKESEAEIMVSAHSEVSEDIFNQPNPCSLDSNTRHKNVDDADFGSAIDTDMASICRHSNEMKVNTENHHIDSIHRDTLHCEDSDNVTHTVTQQTEKRSSPCNTDEKIRGDLGENGFNQAKSTDSDIGTKNPGLKLVCTSTPATAAEDAQTATPDSPVMYREQHKSPSSHRKWHVYHQDDDDDTVISEETVTPTSSLESLSPRKSRPARRFQAGPNCLKSVASAFRRLPSPGKYFGSSRNVYDLQLAASTYFPVCPASPQEGRREPALPHLLTFTSISDLGPTSCLYNSEPPSPAPSSLPPPTPPCTPVTWRSTPPATPAWSPKSWRQRKEMSSAASSSASRLLSSSSSLSLLSSSSSSMTLPFFSKRRNRSMSLDSRLTAVGNATLPRPSRRNLRYEEGEEDAEEEEEGDVDDVDRARMSRDSYVILGTSLPMLHEFDAKKVERTKQASTSATNKVKEEKKAQQFGLSLLEIKENTGRIIPRPVEDTIDFLKSNSGDEVEGLFRRCARVSTMREVQERYDDGETVDFNQYGDPHLAGAILKKFLRELSEPLMTFELFEPITRLHYLEQSKQVGEVQRILKDELPEDNYIILKHIFQFLEQVISKSDVNLMTAANMATVFGPNIAWPKGQANLSNVEQAVKFALILLENFDDVFLR